MDTNQERIFIDQITSADVSKLPNQTLPLKPSHKNKNAATIFVVFFLVILTTLALAYYNAKQPAPQTFVPSLGASITPSASANDTSGWQTYRNEEYGFEFKYPNEWHVGTEGGQSRIDVINKADSHDISISIILYPNSQQQEVSKEWLINWMNQIPITMPQNWEENIIITSFLGFPAVTYDQTMYFAHADNIFSIRWTVEDIATDTPTSENQKLVSIAQEVYNQILSTFRFITNDNSKYIIGQDNTEFIQTYIGDVPSDQTIGMGSIAIGVMSGDTIIADVIVTTPDGLKVGYDPRTSTTFEELKDCASITVDQIAAADGSGVVSDPVLWFYTNCVKDGTYTIQIIGKNQGSYNLYVIGYGEKASNQSDIADKIIRDELDTYTFTYSTEFGFREDLVKVN